jgi:hypothetical protein
MNASPNGTSPAAPAGVTVGPPSENRGYEDAMPVRLDKSLLPLLLQIWGKTVSRTGS